MSREIKFRVWDKQTKSYEWDREFVLSSSGELMELCSNHNGTWEYHFADTDRFIDEQYPGLKDKNGKEIYENCELDGRYRVEYIAPKFVGKDMVKGDIIELYDNKFTITKEHCEISQNSERGTN